MNMYQIQLKKQEEILDNYKKSCKGIIHSCYKLVKVLMKK